MKKYILIIIIIIVLIAGWFYKNQSEKVIQVDLPAPKNYANFEKENSSTTVAAEDLLEDNKLTTTAEIEQEINEPVIVAEESNSINLAIPFTSQAPTANWDQPFQDACEEASVLMVAYYYQDKKMPAALEVEEILKDMINWQAEFMAGTYDITVEETGRLAQGFFDYQSEVITPLTAQKIRELLKTGVPVIVPANGHILDNPYFRGDGPDYHMLVIRGFIDDKFITNDPGTKNGADFIYTEKNLMAAIADWDSKKALAVGPQTALVLYKD